MGKYFGTDGIRGKAGEFPLDRESVKMIGASLARGLRSSLGRDPFVVTGRDTRESGSFIEASFQDGFESEGGRAASAGVIPTPGVAYLARSESADAGIVISASHNPFEDNGIKIFTPSGRKVSSEVEDAIERDIDAGVEIKTAQDPDANRRDHPDLRSKYLDHLHAEFSKLDLKGMRIVVDCANGAASDLAPRLFSMSGAEVYAINCAPDGRNINLNCGSLHLDGLRDEVSAQKADVGVAFDGDADRALFVDENGDLIDGDGCLWVMARHLLGQGLIENKKVVATVMSNLGLEKALASIGVELIRTNVGDKYVLDELLRTAGDLGGEQSGHIIFPQKSIVGDGMITAMYFLEAVRATGDTASGALKGFIRYPQTLVNVKVEDKREFDEVPLIAAERDRIQEELDGNGRILLRYSGTENLARIMIEGANQASIDRQAAALANVIASQLGIDQR